MAHELPLNKAVSKIITTARKLKGENKIAKTILKNKAGGFTLSNTKIHLRLLKTVFHWHEERQTDQWGRIKSLEINLCIFDNPFYDKNYNTVH